MKHSFTDIKYNGDGGDGNYAVISISYDVGESVIVEHNGETYEAPDTSGIWLFGCEEAGTYVCSMTAEGITDSRTITIIEKGQIEEVHLSIQVAINYKMLYYLGDECNDITGGWTTLNVSTIIKRIATNNIIDVSEFNKPYIFGRGSLSCQHITNSQAGNRGRTAVTITPSDTSIPSYSLYKDTDTVPTGTTGYSGYYRGVSSSTWNTNKKICAVAITGYSLGSSSSSESFTKSSYYLRSNKYTVSNANSGTVDSNSDYYAIGFAKDDDISGLSNYGTTESEIISNASNLFKDTNSLRWMCRNCTGTFMINALSNEDFVNVMNNSENKTILMGNEHWSKFIDLLSITS